MPTESNALRTESEIRLQGAAAAQPIPGPSQEREDLVACVGSASAETRQLVLGPCRAGLDLLHQNLPAEERVRALLPVRPSLTASATNSLLALTDRRLLLVTPAPQAASWPLPGITHFQFVPGSAVHIHSDGGKIMLGADPGTASAGTAFEAAALSAIAEAVIRRG